MDAKSLIVTGFIRRKFVLPFALGMLVSACGAGGIGMGSSPTPTTEGRFDLTATNTDGAVAMRVGQTLEVVLHAPNGMTRWNYPDSSDESVLAPIADPAATSARDVTVAAFRARKAGQAEVSSTASPLCSPGQACPMYLAVYSLRVTVTP